MLLTEENIAHCLAKAQESHSPPENPYKPLIPTGQPRLAAVLIPFFWKENEWHLLFIRRTINNTDRHGGQVAFPGGQSESGDDTPQATALREAQEEIGIARKDITILGQLQDVMTITNFQVTPIVGSIPWPHTLSSQDEEVSRIFSIPLSWLMKPENREVRHHDIQFQGQPIPVIHFSPYD
ncbi:MAG: CoA pyrophosphatase, partial [Chloroflexota bacterium]